MMILNPITAIESLDSINDRLHNNVVAAVRIPRPNCYARRARDSVLAIW